MATYRQSVVIGVWLACLVLLGVTLSSLPMAHRTVVLAVLALSTVKVVLVAAYYMHLKFDPRFLTLVATAPIPLAVILAVILLLDRP